MYRKGQRSTGTGSSVKRTGKNNTTSKTTARRNAGSTSASERTAAGKGGKGTKSRSAAPKNDQFKGRAVESKAAEKAAPKAPAKAPKKPQVSRAHREVMGAIKKMQKSAAETNRQRVAKAGSNREGMIRLNKFLAEAGVCSRREADRLMEEGIVTVNDQIVGPGTVIALTDKVKVNDEIIHGANRKAVVAFYKPVGVTTTSSDPHAEITLEDVFKYPIPLTYAGRLDRDSEGLLIMTNDGTLIDAMMRGANGHEKEYVVRTRSKISDMQLRTMEKGIWLNDLEVKTRPCKIDRLGEYTFRIVLTQGLNRQIRRMCKAVGAEVKSLKRVRVLNITAKGLHPGMQREITGAELEKLYAEAGL